MHHHNCCTTQIEFHWTDDKSILFLLMKEDGLGPIWGSSWGICVRLIKCYHCHDFRASESIYYVADVQSLANNISFLLRTWELSFFWIREQIWAMPLRLIRMSSLHVSAEIMCESFVRVVLTRSVINASLAINACGLQGSRQNLPNGRYCA